MTVRWTFTEIGTATPQSYTMEVNPNEGGSPGRTRNAYIANTSGPGGSPIVQAGRLEAETIEFAGTILSQDAYQAMDTWASKNVVIQIVDDLGRTFVGIFTDFTPDRQRRAGNQWYHTYTAKFLVSGLNPEGIPAPASTNIYYVQDDFNRAPGSTVATIFGNEELSGQPWTNGTADSRAYNTISYNSASGAGSLTRYETIATTDWYATTAVPVIQNGDVTVGCVVNWTTLKGTVGVFARCQSANPTISGQPSAWNGGGYLAEAMPVVVNGVQKMLVTLSNAGIGEIGRAYTSFTPVAGTSYTLQLRCYSSTISAFFYSPASVFGSGWATVILNGRARTNALVTVTDVSYVDPGYCGISTFSTQDATVDNFFVRGI